MLQYKNELTTLDTDVGTFAAIHSIRIFEQHFVNSFGESGLDGQFRLERDQI